MRYLKIKISSFIVQLEWNYALIIHKPKFKKEFQHRKMPHLTEALSDTSVLLFV